MEKLKVEYIEKLKTILDDEIEINSNKLSIKKTNTFTNREKLLVELLDSIINTNDSTEKNIVFEDLLFENIELEKLEEYFLKNGFELGMYGELVCIKAKNKENQIILLEYLKALDIKNMIITELNNLEIVMYYSFNDEISNIFGDELRDLILSELIIEVELGISKSHFPKEIKLAYFEAKSSLELGLKYELVSGFYRYDNMMIYRIISNLKSIDIDNMNEKIVEARIELLENHDIKTANVFLENNLNISEAARKLFIHRNTLIYRLEKINKITGYDLRVFKDAMEFRVIILAFIYYNNVNFV